MKRKAALPITAALIVNMLVPIKGLAYSAVKSDKYTVGTGYILGVEQDCSVEDFLNGLDINESAEVYANGNIKSTDAAVANGDVLKVSVEEYTIETIEPENNVIFLDDFENGKTGKWGTNSLTVITDDPEKGKVLSWDASRANLGISFDSRRSISVNGKPKVLIHEIDFKYPVLSNTLISLIMRNSADKYLTTTRLLNAKDLYALDPSGYKSLMNGVKADTWYHAKYVMDIENGKMDMYIDGRKTAENMDFQAVKNSPDNYIPIQISAGGDSTKAAGILLSVDNVTLYEPAPLKTEAISYVKGDTESRQLTGVPVDTDEIRVKLKHKQDTEINGDSVLGAVSLINQSGNKVNADISYNQDDMICTVKPLSLLNNDSKYTIKISGITDTLYGTEYNAEYSFMTDSTPVPFVLKSVTAYGNGTEYKNLTKLPSDIDKINLQFSIQDGNEINTNDIENHIGIYDDNDERISTSGLYDSENHIYTITLNDLIKPNKNYVLKISDLSDKLYDKKYNSEVIIRSAASWVVNAGDVVYSNDYNVTETSISGIICGTDAASIWQSLNVLPGTKAIIYTDNTMTSVNKGLLADGNVMLVENSLLEYRQVYTLKLTGCYIESDIYNIGSDFIMGIKDGTEKDEFLKNISIYGSSDYKIYHSNGDKNKVDKIENNDILEINCGSKSYSYILETDKAEDKLYLNDDFEDGSRGKWNSGEIGSDTLDLSKGNTIYWNVEGASKDSPKSISGIREIAIDDDPEILVYETDFRLPIMTKTTITNYLRNSKDKILSTIRVDDRGQLGALVPNAATVLIENLQNKWYHAKYISDCVNGQMDAYIDGKLVGEGLKFQADSDYKPVVMTTGGSGITVNGTVLMMDNIKLYQPNPIKVSSLTAVKNDIESADIRKIKVDTDKIKLKFSLQDGADFANDDLTAYITLADSDGKEIKTSGNFDKSSLEYTLNILEVLKSSSKYTIKIDGIRDTVYKKNYKDSFDIYTGQTQAEIKNAFIINSSGDMSDALKNEKITVYIPFVNTGEKADITLIFMIYDKNGRAVRCFTQDITAEKASLAETVLNMNLSDLQNDGLKAKIYLKDKRGPICVPSETK